MRTFKTFSKKTKTNQTAINVHLPTRIATVDLLLTTIDQRALLSSIVPVFYFRSGKEFPQPLHTDKAVDLQREDLRQDVEREHQLVEDVECGECDVGGQRFTAEDRVHAVCLDVVIETK